MAHDRRGIGGRLRKCRRSTYSADRQSFIERAGHRSRSQSFANRDILLTGTGVVPDESLALAGGDRITIDIDGIGIPGNAVLFVA